MIAHRSLQVLDAQGLIVSPRAVSSVVMWPAELILTHLGGAERMYRSTPRPPEYTRAIGM